MLIMSPSDAAIAIGGKCGGSAPSDEDAHLIAILNLTTTRVEAALNVDSLVLGEHTDRFSLPTYEANHFPTLDPKDPKLTLRLCNAFLIPDTIVLKDADGVVVDTTGVIDIDFKYGLIHLTDWTKGVYTVEYLSGFEPITPDPEPVGYDPCRRVLANTPDWMKAIVVDMLVQWYRTELLAPRAVKDIRYGQLAEALSRMLFTRIYSRYMRPRAGVIWGDSRDTR
jgi:hypothetical protein